MFILESIIFSLEQLQVVPLISSYSDEIALFIETFSQMSVPLIVPIRFFRFSVWGQTPELQAQLAENFNRGGRETFVPMFVNDSNRHYIFSDPLDAITPIYEKMIMVATGQLSRYTVNPHRLPDFDLATFFAYSFPDDVLMAIVHTGLGLS